MKLVIATGIAGVIAMLSQVPDVVPAGLPSLLGTGGSLGILAWYLYYHTAVAQPAERREFSATIAKMSEVVLETVRKCPGMTGDKGSAS